MKNSFRMRLFLKLVWLWVVVPAVLTLNLDFGMAQGKPPQIYAVVDLGKEVMYPVEAPLPPGARVGALMGGTDGERWLKPKQTAAALKGKETYRLYTLNGAVGQTTGSLPREGGGNPFPEYLLTLEPVPAQLTDLIGVSGTWNAMPRPVQQGSTDDSGLRKAAALLLESKGLTNPQVKLTQVLRVDLDGDGKEDYLVSANHYAEGVKAGGRIHAGDYSMVFLQRREKGQSQTILLEGEFFPSSKGASLATSLQVCGVIDANGDGGLEVVLRYKYYEGAGALMYHIQGNKVKRVLDCGWGA